MKQIKNNFIFFGAVHQDFVFELKNELIALNNSVLSDAPHWGGKEIQERPTPANVDSVELERLLKKIDTNKLPQAYNPSMHQKYVDKRIEGMSLKPVSYTHLTLPTKRIV